MSTRHTRPSPFASSTARASASRERGPLRVAFLGRTSTEDQQDPTISIPRQLRACQAALPEDAVIVAQFYDVESGRKDLRSRGSGRAHEALKIPVRRDGGISDLLERAGQVDRGFDAGICESVDRIARRTYYGVLVEHTLSANLSANTSSNVFLTDTSAVTLAPSSGNAFSLTDTANLGNITIAGALDATGPVNLLSGTNGNISLNANLTGSTVTLSANGSGSISQDPAAATISDVTFHQ